MDNSSEGDPYLSLLFLPLCFLLQVTNTVTLPPTSIAASSNLLLPIVICSLVVAAFLRSARTAIFSLTDENHSVLNKQSTRLAERVKHYLDHIETFALSIRWASDTLYLIAAIGLYMQLHALLLAYITPIFIAGITILTIWWLAFILEFMLSSIAVQRPFGFAHFMAMPVSLAYILFSPFAKLWQSRYKLAPLAPPLPDNDMFNEPPLPPDPTSEESDVLVPETANTNGMLKGMAKFKHLSVKQIMCNRVDIYAIDKDTNFKTLCAKVIEWGYSRVPVYDEDLDHIIGILYTKELLRSLEEVDGFDWTQLTKPAHFVPQNKKVNDLLKDMQRSRVHLAIAVDEFGSTSGLITLEDILEEIVGDIRDEYDEDDMSFKRLDRHQYVFNGRTPLSDMCRIMRINPDLFDKVKGEAESLGGLLIELAGKFPDENETITHDGFFFTVLTRRSNRIDEVKVTLLPNETANI